MAILAAIAVNEDGYREVLGAAEGMKGDKCLGMLEAVSEVLPVYRNIFSVTPRSKVKLVAKMLKAIHAQESKRAAREKAKAVRTTQPRDPPPFQGGKGLCRS